MDKLTDKLYNWASILDDKAREQAERTSRLPIVEGHIALMADAHWGMGSTVGSVIPTKGAVIPAAIGVDIGCGMVASLTTLTSFDLPDKLDQYLHQAQRDVPAGVGQGHHKISESAIQWLIQHPTPTPFSEKQTQRALSQFGSLGSGNHFYEVCLDESDRVWIVLHSGSRGIGNELATIHINKAKSLMDELNVVLEDKDLAYFTQERPEFQAYIADMLWAQQYAYANRQEMADIALSGLFHWLDAAEHHSVIQTINCHHNYCTQETHDGQELWITRKGAIRAGRDDLGVIPGSMGAASYIVQGNGNPESYQSSSHGAGRLMSRGEARRTIDPNVFKKQMSHTAWQEGDAAALVDEAPGAYKPIDVIMEDQKDLVTIVHTLHQVFNYKGVETGRRRR